jgi:hypothetical protein
MTQALYIYCFAPASYQAELNKLCAKLDHVALFSAGQLVAIYRQVAVTEFTGKTAEANLQDATWVLPRVQLHEAIIAQVMQISPIFPARFATLYSNHTALENFLQKNQYPIADFLQTVAGQQEWAVKGLLDKKTAIDYLVDLQLADNQTQLAESKGKRYFQQRQIQMQAEKQLSAWLQQLCDAQLAQLMPLAQNWLQRPVVAGPTENQGQCVINWAFLLKTEHITAFQQKLTDINTVLQQTGLRFEYSGPWAAYTFSQHIEIEN